MREISHDAKIQAWEIEEMTAKAEAAKAELIINQYSASPHRLWPVAVYREGQQWVCEMVVMQDKMKNVIAYGSSPSAACQQFDILWNSDVPDLDPDEPEEEF